MSHSIYWYSADGNGKPIDKIPMCSFCNEEPAFAFMEVMEIHRECNPGQPINYVDEQGQEVEEYLSTEPRACLDTSIGQLLIGRECLAYTAVLPFK